MDTDALLRDIRRYSEEHLAHGYGEADRDLAQTVALLDTYLTRGGALPSEWTGVR